MPAICHTLALALLGKMPPMRPTVWMSLTIAFLGAIAAFVAVSTMKAGQKFEDKIKLSATPENTASQPVERRWWQHLWFAQKNSQTSSLKDSDETSERSRWPWLGFITGPGSLQLTALLAGMLVASVSGEFAWTGEQPARLGKIVEWDADLSTGDNVHEISLVNTGEISLVVNPSPNGTAATLLLVETSENGGLTRNLKIEGGQPATWRAEPSSTNLLVIARASNPKNAPKVHFSVFLTSRGTRG